MNRKLPPAAFEFYFSLGPGRSYGAVARHYTVSKRAVVNLARREDWPAQLNEISLKARDRTAERLEDTLAEMNDRHLKILRVLQGKALETLRSVPLKTAMDAARAVDMTIRQERLIRGEPSERTEVSVAETVRREYERWMTRGDAGGDLADPERCPEVAEEGDS